ncbi:MAG: hypothetical protein ACK56F_11490 [bacterium]
MIPDALVVLSIDGLEELKTNGLEAMVEGKTISRDRETLTPDPLVTGTILQLFSRVF